MTGVVLGTVVTLLWLATNLWTARREYRQVYARSRAGRMSIKYGGGRNTHRQARDDGLEAAFRMLCFWWLIMPFRGVMWLITGPDREPVPKADRELIKRLEKELGIGKDY